jgi:PAS domain S-box-containing protein
MTAPAATQPIRVLMVEDNPGDARLIFEMLRDVSADDFALERVDRLEPALARLGQTGVDVVLLDLELPDSVGLETLERARRGTTTEPIVVISGLDDEQLALDAVRAGAQDYLVKGRIEGQLLARVIRYAIERKRVEAALAASEAHYRTILENVADAVFEADAQGRFVDCNLRACEVSGYTREELLRLTVSDTYPPEDRPVAAARLAELAAGRGSWFQRRLLRKDGSVTLIEGSPVRLPDGRYLATFRDITERARADEALSSRARLAELNAEVGIALAHGESLQDILQRCTAALVRHLDAAFARIWTLNDHTNVLELQASAGQYTHLDGPHSRVPVGQFKIGLIAQQRRPHLTNSVIGDLRVHDQEWAKREGMVAFAGYPLTVQDRVVGVMAMFARHPFGDFDQQALASIADGIAVGVERKRAEESLRVSEQRARTLFETVHLIVLGLDAQGRVDYVNPFFLRLTGYTREETLGQPWLERFLPKAQQGRLHGAFLELLEGNFRPHYQSSIVTKAGEERMIAWNNTMLRDAQGRHTGTLSIGEDITEHSRLEEQFRQAQKMEAVGRLAGGIAHDFNNLLTVISSYSELLLEDLPVGDDARRDDLGQIKKAAGDAAALTRQLLAFSRQQVLAPRVVDLNEIVTGAGKMLQRLIGEDITLTLVLAPELGWVKADPGQIEQVIMNLAVNARDAMPEGGKVTIETANVELDASYVLDHSAVAPGTYVQLVVSDTGVGMTEEVKRRLFEPFFTSKEVGKGTGLGLATVYGIVKQSGGSIWVYSEPGQGATFKIYLPRVDEAEARDQRPEAAAPPARGNETVLLAEDAAPVRNVARQILERQGYTVLEAPNGRAALDIAARFTFS